MKISTVIGARPQFIKAAAVSAKFAELRSAGKKIKEVIIHTGQHYDREMSDIFFEEMGIPEPAYNLGVGSGLHGKQTGIMLAEIEKVLIKEKPDYVLIYGDTNSTAAGALAAVKINIPCAHVEAGMRSFNRRMPEEINRIIADHICDINFCSTKTAVENLQNEGLGKTAELTGDVMFDCSVKFANFAEKRCNPLQKYSLSRGKYVLMTCHRAENTNSKKRLSSIVAAVNKLAEQNEILYPIHPRIKNYLEKHNIQFSDKVHTVDPVGYFDMLVLEKNASCILTDSGGIQKEAFFYKIPCVTMRDETEWNETVACGWNTLCGADKKRIISSVANFAENPPENTDISPYGDGEAAEKIIDALSLDD